MDRKKKQDTVEQKERWFGPERNKRRRDRYKRDTQFRKQVLRTNRESYRSLKGRRDIRNCLDNLESLASFGSLRSYKVSEKQILDTCFTEEELAKALGDYSKVAIFRWFRRGQLPRPVYPVTSNPDQKVYTMREVEALILAFSQHQKEKMYFTQKDLETIHSLHEAVEGIRGN